MKKITAAHVETSIDGSTWVLLGKFNPLDTPMIVDFDLFSNRDAPDAAAIVGTMQEDRVDDFDRFLRETGA